MGAAGRSLILRSRSALVTVLAVAGAIAGTTACGGEEPALPEQVAPPPELPPPPLPPGPTSIYGPDGELLESDRTVAGLRLPLGLEPLLEEERHHVYRSSAPITKVQRYFGVRLVTGEVDRRPGGGATYRDAVPRDVRGGQVHLDVTIEPSSSSEARVEIEELVPPPVTPPPEAETIQRTLEHARQAD